jgi:hypothetical protein
MVVLVAIKTGDSPHLDAEIDVLVGEQRGLHDGVLGDELVLQEEVFPFCECFPCGCPEPVLVDKMIIVLVSNVVGPK